MQISNPDSHQPDFNRHDHLIFLISLPRSGSTLLQRILCGNEHIHSTAEPWIMLHPLHAFKTDCIKASYDQNLAATASSDFLSQIPENMELFYRAVRHYGLTLYNRALESSGKRLFLDKTPRYYAILPELWQTFPRARYIILLRNPLAVLSSVLQTWFNNDPQILSTTSNHRDLIEGPRCLLDGLTMLGNKVHIVHYERLVSNPEKAICNLCDYLEISYSEEMLNYGAHKAPRGRFGDNVGINLHDRPDSSGMNKWLQNLTSPKLRPYAVDYLNRLGHGTTTQLGYDFDAIASALNTGGNSSRNIRGSAQIGHASPFLLSTRNGVKSSYEQLLASLEGQNSAIIIEGIQRFIKKHPDLPDAHNDLGVLHGDIGAYDDAYTHYQKAVALDSSNIIFQKNLADFQYVVRKDTYSALNTYTTLLKNNPSDTELLFAIGCISVDLGNMDDAHVFFNRILEIDPAHYEARCAIGSKSSEGISNSLQSASDSDLNSAPNTCSQYDNSVIVSAIVSVYNAEKYVEGCLEDLLAQSIADKTEIIIVDSGSTENEASIVRRYQKQYNNIKYIRTENRETVYAAWNRGIKDAKGKYITNANADDRHRFDAFEIMARTLDQKLEVALVYADCLITETENETFTACSPVGAFKWMDWNRGKLLNRGCFIGPQPMWRRSLHDEYGYFDPEFVTSGDYEFWLRISQTHDFYHIHQFLGLYLRSPQSIEHQNTANQKIENKRIHERYCITQNKSHRYNSAGLQKPHQLSEIRVSAIISTYNSEIFMGERLNNLIQQTLYQKGCLEIIVIDSNSSQNEKEIVDEFCRHYDNIHFLRTPDRETVYAAWNRGIKLARGTYFVNANTDDRFAKNALEYMADILDNNRDYDAAYGNWLVTNVSNDSFGSKTPKSLFVYPDFHPGLFFYLQITSHANFVRRSVFKQIGVFDGSYTVLGDREFMFRFSAAGYKALKIDKTIGLYLNNPTSVEKINKDIGKQESKALYTHYLAPERFALLMGYTHHLSPEDLSCAYTHVGCFGVGLYDIEGKPMNELFTSSILFSKASELDSTNIIALNNIGIIAQHLNSSQAGIDYFKKAIQIANQEQSKVIDHNLKLAKRNESHIDLYKFLFPPDYKWIRVLYQSYQDDDRPIVSGTLNAPESKPETKPNRPNSEQSKEHDRSSGIMKSNDVSNIKHFAEAQADISRIVWLSYVREDYGAAFKKLLDVIAIQPDNWEAYALMVDVMIQSGLEANIPEQLRHLEERTDLPAWVVALIGSGYLSSGDLSCAAEFAEQALAMNVECARAWDLKGVLAYRNGDPDAAKEYFTRAAKADEKWGEPWTNLGSVYWELGNHQKALINFERGFGLSPTAPNVATVYHAVVSETGQYERAKPLFEDVVERYPDFKKTRYLLIDILIRLEAYADALIQIEILVGRFGTDPQLLEAAKAVRDKVGPATIQKDKHPSLSLCMIVKNEEKYLPRCLDSLKPLVDEMIVVDTGSTDATRDIAEVFGAKVFDFEWNDDFAAARNHSLEQATGDWILVMDADEVIAPKDHQRVMELLDQTTSEFSSAYLMTTRNYTDRHDDVEFVKNVGEYDIEKSDGWIPSKKVRLFRNQKGIHFVYPVHELIDPVLTELGILPIECPVPVHHFGKLDQARMAERWQMYYDLGKIKLASQTENDSALKELAIQAGLLSKWAEAEKHWKTYIDRNPDSVDACMNMTRIMANRGKYEQANHYAQKAFDLSGNRSEPIYNLALSELQSGQAAKAVQTAAHLVNIFPDDQDGKVLHALAEICSGNSIEGSKQIAHLTETVSKEVILPRVISIIASIRSAGFDEWVSAILTDLSHLFDPEEITQRAATKLKKPSDSAPQQFIPSNEDSTMLFKKANQCYEKEDYQAAFDILWRVVASESNHWEAYQLLVDVMLQSGQGDTIPSQLRPLESRSDLPADMIALVGSGYEAASDLPRADQFAEHALTLDTGCTRAWNLKGVLAYRNGNLEEAKNYFQKAVQKDHEWGEPFTNLGTVYWKQGSHDKALKYLEKGLNFSPTAPNVATAYHAAVIEADQFGHAKDVFVNVVERHPDFRKARFLLIDILIRLESYTDALSQIESLIVIFGPDPQLLGAAKAVRAKLGPMTIQEGKKPSLSLCMIVKNEENYLPRCLESLKSLVDEMIVVDTGSTDATRDIAEIFGAKVFDFEWNDDFADARNGSLEKASGDWILVMDADETISANDHKRIRNLIQRPKPNPCAFMVVTRNYSNEYNTVGWQPNHGQYPLEEAGSGWIPSEKVRLFPNDEAVRFQYPIHEVVGPSLRKNNIKIKSCSFPIHHYGKLDTIRERQKNEHYYKIGIEKLNSAKSDPVAIREMAVQTSKLGKFEDSIKFWKRLAELEPDNARCFINMAYNYARLKRYSKAKQAAQKAVKMSPGLKEAYLNLGLSELHLGNPSRAANIFRRIVKNHKNYYSAIYLLGASYLCLENFKDGEKTLQCLHGKTIWKDIHHAFQNLIESLISAGCLDLARNLIEGTELLNCSSENIIALRRRIEMEAA